ncbi:MAG TPA: hypothetical protein PKE66_14410 [Pyrinomonadaceae bacterium]|nr:hypothetical protein [Pyrinomonadaceae bacterium]
MAERIWFTSVPNLLFELADQPLDLRLYLEYLRIAHLPPKDRPRITVADLRKRWQVSDRSIRQAKIRLQNAGLIRFESRRSKGLPDDVQIIDIWKRNAAHFKRLNAKPNAPERETSRSTTLDLTLQSVTYLSTEEYQESEIKNRSEIDGYLTDCVREFSGGDSRLIEIAILETMINRRQSPGDLKPIRSPARYFEAEIRKWLTQGKGLDTRTIDGLLEHRKRQILHGEQ